MYWTLCGLMEFLILDFESHSNIHNCNIKRAFFYEMKPFFWNEWMQIKIVEFISIKKSTNPFNPMNSNRNQNRNGFVQCAWQNNRGFLLKDKEQHVANRKTWGPLVFIFCCLICLSKDTLLYILVNLKKVAGACFTKKSYIT